MDTAVAETPPLKFGTRIGFGLGAIAPGVAGAALAASTLQFYLNQVVGVSPVVAGTLSLITLAVDAILDPLIGQWSDSLRSRWGRRHPFMYVAALLWALAFFFLWHAPKDFSGGALLAYMLTLLLTVRLASSLYEIPSNALVPELAPHYDDRTGLLSFRWFFLVVGLASTSFILNVIFLRKDAAHPLGALSREGYAHFGVFGAAIMVVFALISALSTHSRIRYLHAPPVRRVALSVTMREMVTTLAHPALLILMLCGLLGGIAGGLRNALDTYFYLHFWKLLPQQIGILLPVGVLGSVVAVIVAPILSRRLGKKLTMLTFFTFSTIISLLPMTLKLMDLMPTSIGLVLLILAIDSMVVATLGVSGFIIISSMVADVVEDNAVRTGVRSEGLLFAANGLIPKFTTGIGVFIAGSLLRVVNFPNHAIPGTVPWSLMTHLTLLFLPVYVLLVVGSLVVLLFYRIDRNTHEQNLVRMREAAALASVDQSIDAETTGAPFTPSLRPQGEA